MCPTPPGNLSLPDLVSELSEYRAQGGNQPRNHGRIAGLWQVLDWQVGSDLYELLCTWYETDTAHVCLTARGEALLWLDTQGREAAPERPYCRAAVAMTPGAAEALHRIAAEDKYESR